MYAKQVVAGLNYKIHYHVGSNDEYIIVKVYQPLPSATDPSTRVVELIDDGTGWSEIMGIS